MRIEGGDRGLKTPIVFACDINMVVQTFITISSILENRKSDYEISFFVLVSEREVIEKGQVYVRKLLQMFANVSFNFILVEESVFENVPDTMNYITKTAMYRLLIPDYLSQYDRCLYLDGDIYVKGDIIELLEQNIEDNYMGGVLALFGEKPLNRIATRLNMDRKTPYINSGVLLLNLCKLRKDNMLEVFKRTLDSDISQSFIMQDQDLINKCCNGKIKLLAPRYNMPVRSYAETKDAISFLYKNDVKSAWEDYDNPFIVHYAGEWLKPWKCPQLKLADTWWRTARLILSAEELTRMQKDAEENSKEMLFSVLLSKLTNADTIVIFGFSEIAKQLSDSLAKNNIGSICGFCDNDVNKQRLSYKNINCYSVAEATKRWESAVYIISVQTRRNAIEEQLTDLGIHRSQIIQYMRKPRFLDEMVTEDFKKKLLEDSALEGK